MKKAFIFILLPLLITGCSNVEPEQSDVSDTEPISIETNSFLQQEQDLIRLNAGQSNYSNSVNLKGSVPGKMCYVEETDTLFYSDINGLFQKTGKKTVKLLDTQVTALNVADGKLYFIIPEGETAFYEFGKAFRMDLADGKTECIIDEDIINMSVYKDRIFYRKAVGLAEIESGTTSYSIAHFKCGRDGGDHAQIFDQAFSFDDDMCVTCDGNSINILDLSDGTSEKLIDEPNIVKNLSLYDGGLYYIRSDNDTLTDVLVRVDLADKTAEEFTAAGYIEDYGFSDGRLCVYDLTDFYLEEDGKLIKYDTPIRTYRSIYTCGNKVYGISGEKLYEIGFSEEHQVREVSETEIGGGDET